MTKNDKTIVVFRVWPESGDVIALFPFLIADISGIYCLSYGRTGQHGSASDISVMSHTRPAAPDEYATLKMELEGIPYRYNLKAVRRINRYHAYESRRSKIRGYYKAMHGEND